MRKARRQRTAVDLFCGAGGLTVGLQSAGFEVIAAVEVDPLAAATYRLNHPGISLRQADIRDLDPREVLAAAGFDGRRRLDLLAGCPPCQGFSSVRTLNGSRTVEDARNDLIYEYGRFVEELRPRAVLMENVPALQSDRRFTKLVDLLEELGYPARSGVAILNAADFGVPQKRRRLVLVAAQGRHVVWPAAAIARRTVRQAIGGLKPAGSSGDPLHDLSEVRRPDVLARIRSIPKDGGGRLDLPSEEQLACHKKTTGFKDVYGRMAWDRPAPTITGGCHNPSKGRFLHPEENRAITLREAALLQGFPPTYEFSLDGGKLAAAAMIGNALPPQFVEAHARAVALALDGQ